jgi:uncharacterized tellurite resistance protein B-like protein
MANIPSNVTNLHAIAFLYLAMATDDGQLTESESKSVVQRLYEYNSENPDFNNQVIKETTDWFFSCADLNEKAMFFREMVAALNTLSASLKLAIVNDLEKIAQADGVIHENERVLYNYVLTAFTS